MSRRLKNRKLENRHRRDIFDFRNLRTERHGEVWNKDRSREYLSKLDILKSMGLYGIHTKALRELAGVTVKAFRIKFE